MSTSGPYGAAVPLMEDQEMHDESAVGEKLPYVRRPMTMWRMFGPVAWLFTTTLLAAILLFLVAAITKKPDPNKCPDRLLEWSPALEAVEVVDVEFQNSFTEHSAFRGKPNPEREQAWLDLWNFGPINIPVDRLGALNKSRDANWQRATPEDGGGVVGSLEVFHHIHCLDLVRQYTYRDEWDYSQSPAFDGTPQQIRAHVDHCINSLRLFLQCKVDVTPYLNVLNPERPLGVEPDFNTQHKCINFEKVRAWASKHALDNTKYITASP